MADNNSSNDSEKQELMNSDSTAEKAMSEEDLERVFEEWGQNRDDFLGTGSDADTLNLDDLSVEHEELSDAQGRLNKSRRAVTTRLALLLVLSAVGVVTFVVNWSDIAYYFVTEDDRINIGDIRERWKAGERPGDGTFPELKANSWVQFEGAITTVERESDSGSYFFFEPMLKAIVVTTRAIPEKNPRNIAIDSKMVDLINQKWMYAADISVSFSAQGRLIRAEDAPRRLQPVVRLYRKELHLGTRLKDQTLWLIEDEQAPSGQFIYLIIYGCTILLLALSIWFYLRAKRRHEELVETLVADQDSVI